MLVDRPNPEAECDRPLDPSERAVLRGLLRDCHGDGLDVDGREGDAAALVAVVIGPERKAHEVFVFGRGEDAKSTVVDYLDGLLGEVIGKEHNPERGFHLPLDWTPRDYDGHVVWVRGEVRDYLAEEEAAKLLGEEPLPRALRR